MQEQYNKNGGPRTKVGRETSSRNSLKHGLSVGKLIVPGEDPAEFEALLSGFQDDFDPQNNIEAVLVHDLAKFHWLKERAIRQQQLAFLTELAIDPKHLALMIRYQTANENSFQRTLKSLQTIQKERVKQEKEFVSKTPPELIFSMYDDQGNVVQLEPKITPTAENTSDPPAAPHPEQVE
jgi:hypothetical protein